MNTAVVHYYRRERARQMALWDRSGNSGGGAWPGEHAAAALQFARSQTHFMERMEVYCAPKRRRRTKSTRKGPLTMTKKPETRIRKTRGTRYSVGKAPQEIVAYSVETKCYDRRKGRLVWGALSTFDTREEAEAALAKIAPSQFVN